MTMLLIHSGSEVIESIQSTDRDMEIKCVSSFDEASLVCEEFTPSVIVAQNILSSGTAFDFCTRIRLHKNLQMTPFIIIADSPDKKERVKTFQVGADDYIAPFDPDHLSAVLEHELKSNKNLEKLRLEKDQASHLVMEAMKSSSELGTAINFIERCHRFQCLKEMANETLSFCENLGLKAVIGIREDDDWFFSSSTGQATKLERDLMRSVHTKDRFIDFGIRTQMNWPSIALLIKNMPIRDPERYGRIKDLLPTVLSSANVRVHSLYEEKHIKEQTALMTRSIGTLQPSLESVISLMKQDNHKHRNALSDFLQKIIISLPKLGLEDDQEDFFITKVEALIGDSDQMIGRSIKNQKTLETTNQVLLNLLAKQTEIEKLFALPVEIADKQLTDDNELFELF